MMESWKLFYNKFCKENYYFFQTSFAKKNILTSNQSLPKPRWYMISTRETILFIKYLFQERYRYVNQPWWIFHLSWVVNHYVWPTHSNNISILHSISVIQDDLLSTFKCTHFGFAPGYFIGQTLRSSLRRRSSDGVPRWRLCELGSFPGQQPVGWGVTWALLRCVLFVFRCVY